MSQYSTRLDRKVRKPAVQYLNASYASVNPRGGSVSTCKFEYGTTTSYGSSVSCASLPGGGSSPVAVDAAISSGLVADTTYHYRVSATNSGGSEMAVLSAPRAPRPPAVAGPGESRHQNVAKSSTNDCRNTVV